MSYLERRRVLALVPVALALAAFLVAALLPWHEEGRIRRAVGIVLAALILWISEAAPLGVTGLLIPVGATLAGALTWTDALAAWGDPILFLFLGAFLLARALEKHGAFEFLFRARWARSLHGGAGPALAVGVMLVAGLISTLQSNTAVAAMMLPVVVTLARTVRDPSLVLLALSYGATFGGMATPIGTPPNFLGYAAMKKLDPAVNFLSWMRVGLPIWLGTSMLACGLMALTRMLSKTRVPIDRLEPRCPPTALPQTDSSAPPTPLSVANGADDIASCGARVWAVVAFVATVAIWLGGGIVAASLGPDDPLSTWIQRFLPESLVPVLTAGLLFVVRAGPKRRPVLDRDDFQALDWDTLFLIAGGLCLGKMLQSSGTAGALASAVAQAHLSRVTVMFGLGAATVLLSELTSNTATAALLVPIAGSLAPAVGLSPVRTIWLVALCASLGFALPISTPPNAIVYGTRLVPLRRMALLGILVDVLSLSWVVGCLWWLS